MIHDRSIENSGEHLEDGVQECDSIVVPRLTHMTFTLYKTTTILSFHCEGVLLELTRHVHRWRKTGMEAFKCSLAILSGLVLLCNSSFSR